VVEEDEVWVKQEEVAHAGGSVEEPDYRRIRCDRQHPLTAPVLPYTVGMSAAFRALNSAASAAAAAAAARASRARAAAPWATGVRDPHSAIRT
jgi:hypothetical protein